MTLEGTLSQGNSEAVEYPQVFDPARAIEVDPSELTFGIFKTMSNGHPKEKPPVSGGGS